MCTTLGNYTLYPGKTIMVLLRTIVAILHRSYDSPKYIVYLIENNKNVSDLKLDPISESRWLKGFCLFGFPVFF